METHKDWRIGLYLFCMQFSGDGWYLKVWESCEALIPYRLVLEA
jgi:hypothetical protein